MLGLQLLIGTAMVGFTTVVHVFGIVTIDLYFQMTEKVTERLLSKGKLIFLIVSIGDFRKRHITEVTE